MPSKQHLKKLIRNVRPDIILMNVFYPLHAGSEPLDQIRVHCNGGAEPVVFVTCAGRCWEQLVSAPSETPNARFDKLPSGLKIRVVEKIQRLCAELIRCKRRSGKKTGLPISKTFSLNEFESINTLVGVA